VRNDDLGNLQAVELRSQWPNEASDFTPWLAEHIDRLGEAIGCDLEVENTEVSVGPYSADILARDIGSGGYVVIENQLGSTNHDHLGKALTYAATLNAHTVVWIAARFTDEHRKALDWLNTSSIDDLGFFGVQLELWSIDGSKPAVRFNVVSRPDELVRQAVAQASAETSPTKKLQLEFWTALRDKLLETKTVPSAQSPRPQYWYNIALGRTGYYLSSTANVGEGVIRVRLYLEGRYGGDAALRHLEEDRNAIEAAVGEPLTWNPNPTATNKVVALERAADLTNKAAWPEYVDWMVDAVRRMRSVFGPRVRAMELKPVESGEAEPD
jgi:hypothetical protein